MGLLQNISVFSKKTDCRYNRGKYVVPTFKGVEGLHEEQEFGIRGEVVMSSRTHSGHIIRQEGCGLAPELRVVKGGRGDQVKGAMCTRVHGESDPGDGSLSAEAWR